MKTTKDIEVKFYVIQSFLFTEKLKNSLFIIVKVCKQKKPFCCVLSI